MIPPWLTIAFGALGFLAALFLFLWTLCAAARDADEMLDARTDRRMVTDDQGDELAAVLHLPRERRRSHARNGIGGGSAA